MTQTGLPGPGGGTPPRVVPARQAPRTPGVTTILVVHDGARWLGETLAGVQGQRRRPDRLLAVDTGSVDGSRELLVLALGAQAVLDLPRDTGFGAAVQAGLAALERGGTGEWLWLLHDDSAPEPAALRSLLATAQAYPGAAVLGPKLRGWYDRRHLLEAGVSIAGSGRRETFLERRERDQGQHDEVRDVLAVSTAGMLVRRDLWDELGGLDPALPLLRDDVDFGWQARAAGHRVIAAPAAVLYHAEAASRQRRDLDCGPARLHLADRAAALHVLLANSPTPRLPLVLVRLVVGSLLRSVGLLLAKLPGPAADELLALGVTLGHPGRLVAARRSRRVRREGAGADLGGLFPRTSDQLRHAAETFSGLLASGGTAQVEPAAGRHRAGSEAPLTAPAPASQPGLLGRTLRRPAALVLLGLLALALVAGRGLVTGGRLAGGALLPAPDGARDLWSTYLSAWHPVELGTGAPAPAYLAVLGAVAGLLLGRAGTAVSVLLLGGVPLAGLTAYLAASRVTRAPWLAAWAAITYALLPTTTGAIAAGRLGTVVVVVLLPLLGLAGARVVGREGRPGSWRAAWSAGLLLALAAAFVPLVEVLAIGLAVIAALTVARSPRAWARLAAVLAVPLVVLLPWSLDLLAHPRWLLGEAGVSVPGLADAGLQPWAVLLMHPGGPGTPPWWWGGALLVVGLAGLLRRARHRLAVAGWTVAVVGFLAALVQSRLTVAGFVSPAAEPAWPGVLLAVMALGVLLAALVGAAGLRPRLVRRLSGWRGPVLGGLVLLAVAAPLAAGAWWVGRGAGEPLVRRTSALPAYVAADALTPERPRTLLLRSTGTARERQVAYALLRAHGARIGDGDLAAAQDARARAGDPTPTLGQLVSEVSSGSGGDAASRLARYGVRYVLLAAPVDQDLVPVLDAVPGLSRVSAPGGAALWRLTAPASRLQLLTPGQAPRTVPAAEIGAGAALPAGPAGRTLVLAERADPGWRATLDGRALPGSTAQGWQQAFAVPAAGGRLTLGYDASARHRWLWVQGLALLVVIVLALPGARRSPDALDPEDTDVLPRRRRARDARPGPALSTPPPAAPAAPEVPTEQVSS